jgi:hypothetical protein
MVLPRQRLEMSGCEKNLAWPMWSCNSFLATGVSPCQSSFYGFDLLSEVVYDEGRQCDRDRTDSLRRRALEALEEKGKRLRGQNY